jgi:hypothetical protein
MMQTDQRVMLSRPERFRALHEAMAGVLDAFAGGRG